jgi:multiple sugar transport system ATP-binding protein
VATIQLTDVEKRFGADYAVRPMNLTIEDGEFVVLLGPSGCGKTTTLRMISGLEAVSGGVISFDNDDVTWLRPSERDIAFVFQFFALYSHMTCRENIAFPLQALGTGRGEIDRRVREVAELVQIDHLLDKRPGGLSGGDQQRVALARALVRRPRAFLMDEPLGALDAEFRETMRAEIKRLHLEQRATTVYVTHDQIEAMALGDKIVVMSAAEVQQVGSPTEVYFDPANLFVARFIGSPGMNLLQGSYRDGSVHLQGGNVYRVPDSWRPILDRRSGSGELVVGFRPEAVLFEADGGLSAKVFISDMHGGHAMLHLDVGDGSIVHARSPRSVRYVIGNEVRFQIDAEQVRFFDPDSGRALAGSAAP